MRKRARNQNTHSIGDETRAYPGRATLTRPEALRALGPVVYAVRCEGDIIKIGHTTNFAARSWALGSPELLAFAPGSLADEQAIHARLADHRHHGREWYHPTPEVMAVVNEMRKRLGLDAVA